MREHGSVGLGRGQGADSTEILQRFADQDRTAHSIAFYKEPRGGGSQTCL